MRTLSIIAFFASLSAYAHIEPGFYAGKTLDGTDCSIQAVRQYFVDDIRHPLNERIVLNVGGEEFTVGHPPVIEVLTNTAHFKHEAFEGVRATPTGAKALVIDMIHEEGREGPSAFHLISHEWKASQRTGLHCLELERVNSSK